MAKLRLSPFSHAVLFYCAIAYTAGIMSSFAGLHWGVGVLLMISATALLAMRTLGTDFLNLRIPQFSDLSWLLPMAAGLGIVIAHANKPREFPFECYDSSALVNATITDIQPMDGGQKAFVTFNALATPSETFSCNNTKGYLLIESSDYKVGDEVWFKNRLTHITNHPLCLTGDYATSMRRKGILYRQQCDPEKHDIVPASHHTSWRSLAQSVRTAITEAVCRAPFSEQCRNFTAALLSSDRSLMEPDEVRLFADSGISHITAISGMHVGIMAAILWLLLLPFAFCLNRYARMTIICVLLWLYALICGMSPPVTRACIMATSLYAAAIADRPRSSFNALWGAWLIILIANPYAIYEPGFQLSFATVGCIILFFSFYKPSTHTEHLLLAPILVSIVATVGSWPLIAYHFHRVPLLFLPANILVIPLLPVYFAAAAVCTGLFHIGLAPDWVFLPLNSAYSWLHSLMQTIHETRMVWEDVWLHPVVCALYFSVIITTAWVFASNGKRKAWAALCASAMVLITAAAILPDGRTPDTLAIANDFRDINARSITSGQMSGKYTLNKAEKWRESVICGKLIGCADCRSSLLPDSIATAGHNRCDILIIGRTYEADPALIIERFRPQTVITSSSVSPKRYERIRRYCRSHSIPLHSLKHNGTYRLLLNN